MATHIYIHIYLVVGRLYVSLSAYNIHPTLSICISTRYSREGGKGLHYTAHKTNVSYQWHFINIRIILMFNYPIYRSFKTSISCTRLQIFIKRMKIVKKVTEKKRKHMISYSRQRKQIIQVLKSLITTKRISMKRMPHLRFNFPEMSTHF